MNILHWLRAYRRSHSSYQPLIEISLSKENLLHNLHTVQALHSGVRVAPVLKSNAYGHGLIQVAEMLKDTNVPFLIVDSLFEANTLRHQGIKIPLFIIGYTSVQNIQHSHLRNISFVVTSLPELERLCQTMKRPCKIHLKIDTGMHRQGLLVKELDAAIATVRKNQNICVDGICSHLADADGPDLSFTHQQIATWKEVVKIAQQAFPNLSFIHLSNSAGAPLCDASVANVIRLGLGLYGIRPTESPLKLKPVLEMKTVISSIKTLEPGEKVGYNVTFTAKRPMTIATIPVGYFEGIDRRLSNCGTLMVKNVECPIIGRVSMNITTIDVSAVPGVQIGDSVTVIGRDPDAPNSVECMARLCKTIPYDLLVHLPQHLRRTID